MGMEDQSNSSVWQAKHSDMPDRVTVVKVIKADSADEPSSIRAAESWIRESTIHSSLESHSAVLRMLGSDARFHCIYTEYIDAKSLAHLRRPDSDFSNANISDAQRILADIASALCFVHGSNIAHNDIKPANILYSLARGAVLIDFGLSFLTDDPPRTGGSPWYLPPEFMRNWRSRGLLSDVWALGVVMLWLLGRIPMSEKTKSWMIAHIHPIGPVTPSHIAARQTMGKWLDRIEDVRSSLGHQEALNNIVRDMLAPKKDRISAARLQEQIAKV